MLYRDPEEGYRIRHAELLDERRQEIAALPPAALRVHERRLARQAAGAVLLGFGATLAVATIFRCTGTRFILMLAWPAALVAWLLGAYEGRVQVRDALRRHLEDTDDLRADLERLSAPALATLQAMARRTERRSVSLPLAGLVAIVPLTIHLCVATIAGATSGFDVWITWSLVLVGHCHLILIALAFRFARRIPPQGLGSHAGWIALGKVILASLLPTTIVGAINALLGVGVFVCLPIVVLMTGILFVPASFGAMERVVHRERRELSN